MRTLFTLLALLAVLPGCASRDPLAARQKAYERLASLIEPGMTRRQLYALLPPQRPATLGKTLFTSFPDFRDPKSDVRFWHAGNWETYPLDRDFYVNVSLISKSPSMPSKARPANANAIEALLYGYGHPLAKGQSARPPASTPELLCGTLPVRKQGKNTLSPNAIDALLFGAGYRPPKPVPSKQDPDDTLYQHPEIVRDYSVPDFRFRARPR